MYLPLGQRHFNLLRRPEKRMITRYFKRSLPRVGGINLIPYTLILAFIASILHTFPIRGNDRVNSLQN